MKAMTLAVLACSALVSTGSAQDLSSGRTYLSWSAATAEGIGQQMRVNGRVGGAFDLRVVHTERSYNYRLRATWLTAEVVRATARLAQLQDRLTGEQTESLVSDATMPGTIVVLIEVDPREGSGIVPSEWTAHLGVSGASAMAAGERRPVLEKVRALRGAFRRDYAYEQFWVVFPDALPDGQPLLPRGSREAELVVRILDKEGRVKWPIRVGRDQD